LILGYENRCLWLALPSGACGRKCFGAMPGLCREPRQIGEQVKAAQRESA